MKPEAGAVENDSPGVVIAYLRVSTNEQVESGAGLAAQRASILQYANRAGLDITRWLIDEGVSGSISPLQRPALAQALTELARASTGTLVVSKGDRVARKTADLLALRDLSEKQHWTLRAADGSVDWSTAHGRAMSTVMGAFAELERDLIRTRTREGLQAKKAAGQRLGAPVLLSESTRLRIRADRATGDTLASIATNLNHEGVRTARDGVRWYPSTVRAVLASLDLDDATEAARTASAGFLDAPQFEIVLNTERDDDEQGC